MDIICNKTGVLFQILFEINLKLLQYGILEKLLTCILVLKLHNPALIGQYFNLFSMVASYFSNSHKCILFKEKTFTLLMKSLEVHRLDLKDKLSNVCFETFNFNNNILNKSIKTQLFQQKDNFKVINRRENKICFARNINLFAIFFHQNRGRMVSHPACTIRRDKSSFVPSIKNMSPHTKKHTIPERGESSLHWLILVLFCAFLYNGVCFLRVNF